ncbi:MAG: NAD-binding protein [Acetobacteraceae bacterium]
MNNMVLVQTVIALSEAIAIAAREGMAAGPLLDVLSKGSADSFALRNHGLKAIVPGAFPERAFSVRYARKDISYAIELARAHGLDLPGVDRADAALGMAEAAGDGDRIGRSSAVSSAGRVATQSGQGRTARVRLAGRWIYEPSSGNSRRAAPG